MGLARFLAERVIPSRAKSQPAPQNTLKAFVAHGVLLTG
jgi:hypothetical protein